VTRAWTCVTVTAAVLAGCRPSICFFRADPNVACRGVPVRLLWESSSEGRLVSTPADKHDGKVGDSGSQLVTPVVRTRYRLYATNLWGRDQRDIDVDVVTVPAQTLTIGTSTADPSMRCQDGNVSVTFVAPPDAWDAHLRASSVAVGAHEDRRYRAEHGGTTADLATGTPTTAFADLAVQGTWSVSTPLGPDESCEKLPRSVILDIVSTCSP
jgi:hypothetical protein